MLKNETMQVNLRNVFQITFWMSFKGKEIMELYILGAVGLNKVKPISSLL